MKKLVEKSMEIWKILKIFLKYESIFIYKANFNNIKGDLGGLLEIINNLHRNFNEKLIFTHFLSHLPVELGAAGWIR